MPTTQDSGDMDLDGYCRSLGYSGVRLDPTQQNVNSWGCLKSDGTQVGMNLYGLCKWQYNGRLPYPEYSNYDDPYSWFCSSEDLGAPAKRSTPQSQQQPTQQSSFVPGKGGCPGFNYQDDIFVLGESDGTIWIHAEPSYASPKIKQVPQNQEIYMTSNGYLVCRDGYTWEQMTLEGVTGWIVEYNGTKPTFPLTSQPTPKPTAKPSPTSKSPEPPDSSNPTTCDVRVKAHLRSSMGWFVLEIPKSVKEPYKIYYDNKLVPNNDKGVRHDGYAGETDTTVFLGISTEYAFRHPFGVLINANWKVKYPC